MLAFIAASGGAMAAPRILIADDSRSFCLDSMETVPIEDDLVPTPIAVDGGCMIPEAAISI
jgi:hypothetical protein